MEFKVKAQLIISMTIDMSVESDNEKNATIQVLSKSKLKDWIIKRELDVKTKRL